MCICGVIGSCVYRSMCVYVGSLVAVFIGLCVYMWSVFQIPCEQSRPRHDCPEATVGFGLLQVVSAHARQAFGIPCRRRPGCY